MRLRTIKINDYNSIQNIILLFDTHMNFIGGIWFKSNPDALNIIEIRMLKMREEIYIIFNEEIMDDIYK